jgi:uncharacterized protein
MTSSTQENAQPKPCFKLKAVLWRVVRLILLCYLGILLFLGIAQTTFIFPGKDTQGKTFAEVKASPDSNLIKLKTASGHDTVALFGSALTKDGKPHASAAKRPTVIFFYGNAMCLAQAREEFGNFRRSGFNVIVPEYVGYGMSSGEACEQACYAAADAAYEYLQTRDDIDKSKIVAAGWSLGGAVAIDLASRKKLAGLATFSTFTSMADMGNSAFPFLPSFTLSFILRHHFSSESKIAKVQCPVLIGHSRGDRIIPFRMADRLAAAAPSPAKRITIDKPDHNSFFAGGGETVWNGIREFLEDIASNKE